MQAADARSPIRVIIVTTIAILTVILALLVVASLLEVAAALGQLFLGAGPTPT